MNVNRKSSSPARYIALLRRGSANAGRRLGFDSWMILLLATSTGSFAAPSPTNNAPQLIAPYGEIKPAFWEQYGTIILVAIFVCASLVGALCWLLRLPKPPVITPPEVVARAALTRLLAKPETGKELSEVSQILRRYLVAAAGLPTHELPTTEFCAQIAGHEAIGPELAKVISGFLRECDLRKFSPKSATAPLNAANQALAIIAEMEKQRAKPAPGVTQ
jgi:hypothetical protein